MTLYETLQKVTSEEDARTSRQYEICKSMNSRIHRHMFHIDAVRMAKRANLSATRDGVLDVRNRFMDADPECSLGILALQALRRESRRGEMMSAAGCYYSSDGEMLAHESRRYCYDAKSRLVSVSDTPNSSARQLYIPWYDNNGNVMGYQQSAIAPSDLSPGGGFLRVSPLFAIIIG